jgi:hypothetical protein
MSVPFRTSRDRMLATLLGAWDACHFLRKAQRNQMLLAAAAEELAWALRAVLEAGEMVRPSPRHGDELAAAVASGLPEWLVGDQQPCSLGGILRFLHSPDGGLVVDGELFRSGDLRLLERLQRRLLELNRAAVAPGRLPLAQGASCGELAGWLLDGRQPQAGLHLAARTPPQPGEALKQLETHFADPEDPDRVGRELAGRLLRLPVPVVTPDGLALVIALQVDLDGSGEPRTEHIDDAGQPRLDETFKQGVRAGHQAALHLLEAELGDDDWRVRGARSLRYRVHGLPESTRLEDGSAGLPVALLVLARTLDLEAPSVAATGSLSEKGELRDLRDGTVSKAAAVRHDQLHDTLVARTTSADPGAGVVRLHGHRLVDAADQLWGQQWRDLLRDEAATLLDVAGCSVTRLEEEHDRRALRADDDTAIGIVRADLHERALQLLRKHPDVPVVLGGAAGVGKSWTARTVATALQADGWNPLFLRFKDGRLPGPDEAKRLASLAFRSTRATAPILLVLEGLRAQHEANDLDGVLAPLAAIPGCSVLAVARTHPSLAVTRTALQTEGEYVQNSVEVVYFPNDQEAFLRLARQLVTELDHELGAAAGSEGLAVAASGGDLWWLIHLLQLASQQPDRYHDKDALYRAFLAERTAGLDPEVLRSLAASSLIDVALPPAYLPGLTPEHLLDLGARQIGVDEHWVLSSVQACQGLLTYDADTEPAASEVQAGLEQTLYRVLDAADVELLIQLLTAAGRLDDGSVQMALLELHADRVVGLLEPRTEPAQLARALLGLRGCLPAADRRRLADRLVNLLEVRQWRGLTTGEATMCLRVIRAEADQWADATESDGDTDRLDALFLELREQLPRLLARSRSPSVSLGLLDRLRDFHRDDTVALLGRGYTEALATAEPGNEQHLRSAIDLLVTLRLVNVPDKPSVRATIRGRPEVRALLHHQPDPVAGAEVVLAQLVLRELLEPAQLPGMQALRKTMQARLPGTSVLGLAAGLELVRAHAPQLARTLRACRLGEMLRERVADEPPLVLARLLQALLRVDPRGADRVLLENGKGRATLVEAMGKGVEDRGDVRSLGFLLEAAAKVDEEFADGANGFARLLTGRLWPFIVKAIPGHGRVSVIAEFVRSLLEAGCDPAQLEQLRSLLLGIIRQGFMERTRREHAPRLAMRLAEDDAFGPGFLDDLRRKVPEDRVRQRMISADSADALAAYHQFGLAVWPRLCKRYQVTSTSPDGRPALPAMVSRLRDRRPLSILRALQAVSRTLGYAGASAPGTQLVTLVSSDPAGWSPLLAHIRKPADLAEAVRILGDLAPAFARASLESLRPSRPSDDEDDQAAAPMLRRLVTSGWNDPLQGLNLLVAVTEVHPDLGATVLREVVGHPAWRHRLRGLRDRDLPSEQGQALDWLARLGIRVSSDAQDALLAKWGELMPFVRSPRSIGDLLGGLLPASPAAAASLASRLDQAGLRRRLTRSTRTDGSVLARMLAALFRSDQEAFAAELAGAVADASPGTLGPEEAGRLLAVVRVVAPAEARRLAGTLEPLLTSSSGRRLVLDPVGHWLSIGWLARQLVAAGGRVTVAADAEDLIDEVTHPVVRLWAFAVLPSPTAASRVDRLLSSPPWDPAALRPWAMAAVLSVAGRRERARELLAGAPGAWDPALTSRPDWLVELLTAARRDPALGRWVLERATLLDQRLAAPELQAGTAGVQLEEALTGLRSARAPRHPQPADPCWSATQALRSPR